MSQTDTGATALKEPPDAEPAQASTHARPRTAETHTHTHTHTHGKIPRCPARHASTGTPPSQTRPVASRTRPTASTHPRCQAQSPGTQGVAPTPAVLPHCTSAPSIQARPSTHASRAHRAGHGNRVFCIWRPCARDSGNKIAASAYAVCPKFKLKFPPALLVASVLF